MNNGFFSQSWECSCRILSPAASISLTPIYYPLVCRETTPTGSPGRRYWGPRRCRCHRPHRRRGRHRCHGPSAAAEDTHRDRQWPVSTKSARMHCKGLDGGGWSVSSEAEFLLLFFLRADNLPFYRFCYGELSHCTVKQHARDCALQ